jgi:hypothetical protein
MRKLADKLGLLSLDGWAIYQQSNGGESHVKAHDYLYDVIAVWERYDRHQIYFERISVLFVLRSLNINLVVPLGPPDQKFSYYLIQETIEYIGFWKWFNGYQAWETNRLRRQQVHLQEAFVPKIEGHFTGSR